MCASGTRGCRRARFDVTVKRLALMDFTRLGSITEEVIEAFDCVDGWRSNVDDVLVDCIDCGRSNVDVALVGSDGVCEIGLAFVGLEVNGLVLASGEPVTGVRFDRDHAALGLRIGVDPSAAFFCKVTAATTISFSGTAAGASIGDSGGVSKSGVG